MTPAIPPAWANLTWAAFRPTNFNALQAVLDAAHDTTGGKKRIEVHCWMVTFRTSGGAVYKQHIDPPTGSLTNLDNYWPSRDETGAEVGDKAFDPGHPLVLQYTVGVALDLVNNFDIDGIHYDYIRFTANDQGYNPTSIARYNARYGLTGEPAPSDRAVQAVAARPGQRGGAAGLCEDSEEQAFGQAVRLLRHVEPLAHFLDPGGLPGHAPLLRRLLGLG